VQILLSNVTFAGNEGLGLSNLTLRNSIIVGNRLNQVLMNCNSQGTSYRALGLMVGSGVSTSPRSNVMVEDEVVFTEVLYAWLPTSASTTATGPVRAAQGQPRGG